MTEIFTTYLTSPLGLLKISCVDKAICEVSFCDQTALDGEPDTNVALPDILEICKQQLSEYFNGKRKGFDLPLSQPGTTFQQSVWQELLKIPYGSTISYLELAKRLGNVKAIRAAASTNGRNRIAIVVPCHRVIGSNNQLVGYAGGLPNKRWLLEHETRIAHGKQTLF